MFEGMSRKVIGSMIAGLLLFIIGSGLIVQSMLETRPSSSASPSPSPTATVSPAPSENDGSKDEETVEDYLPPSVSPVASTSASGAPSAPPPTSASIVLPTSSTKINRERVRVARVVDGDTVELADGRKLRYIGINTPETVKPNTPVQCMGKAASARNRELVDGKEIEIEKDVSETDRYGRLLRYVYVGDIFVNQYLVAEGFAQASSYPPDVKYQEIFREAQRKAQEDNKGLWASCETSYKRTETAVLGATENQVPSATYTANVPPPSPALYVSPSGNQQCVIKGNISMLGKIYHLPGCGSYEKTSINLVQGEKWFCSENDAVNAGWRKAKNC